MSKSYFSSKTPTARTLKVGEEIRRALSEILLRGESHIVELEGTSITISEVRVAPDLKNATVYAMPLAGQKIEEIMTVLDAHAPQLRHLVAKKVELRYMPKLYFKLDTSFDEASRINQLLQDPRVRKDIIEK